MCVNDKYYFINFDLKNLLHSVEHHRRQSFTDRARVTNGRRKCVQHAKHTKSPCRIPTQQPNDYRRQTIELHVDGQVLQLRCTLLVNGKPILQEQKVRPQSGSTPFGVLHDQLLPLGSTTQIGKDPTGKQDQGQHRRQQTDHATDQPQRPWNSEAHLQVLADFVSGKKSASQQENIHIKHRGPKENAQGGVEQLQK